MSAMTARQQLLSVLEAIEPHGLEAPATVIADLIHAIACLDKEGLKTLSDTATVLLLAVFPKQPGEPPKPDGLDKCAQHWIKTLKESCAN